MIGLSNLNVVFTSLISIDPLDILSVRYMILIWTQQRNQISWSKSYSC